MKEKDNKSPAANLNQPIKLDQIPSHLRELRMELDRYRKIVNTCDKAIANGQGPTNETEQLSIWEEYVPDIARQHDDILQHTNLLAQSIDGVSSKLFKGLGDMSRAVESRTRLALAKVTDHFEKKVADKPDFDANKLALYHLVDFDGSFNGLFRSWLTPVYVELGELADQIQSGLKTASNKKKKRKKKKAGRKPLPIKIGSGKTRDQIWETFRRDIDTHTWNMVCDNEKVPKNKDMRERLYRWCLRNLGTGPTDKS
jgi:hypothetical protein